MQIILVTHAGRRTRSLHIRNWQIVTAVLFASVLLFGGSLIAWVTGGANLTILQRVVDIWDGTRSDVLAGKIGELRTRIESLEAAMDVQPGAGGEGTLQRQSLREPDGEGLQKVAILELESRAAQLQAELERQLSRSEETLRSVLGRAMEMPVSGHVSSGFGWRKHPIAGEPAFHRGIDFSAPAGTAVNASAPGVVTFIGPADAYGKLVVISHGDRVQSRYAHLEGIEVTTGMAVAPGQRIGRVGSTGRSTGPHLHFELVIDGRVVNPKPFLGSGTLDRAALDRAPAA
jgi:murein DD-endopeptidase MepM/ murein hydrolase activator NlpD